jgi:hypothetical protein
MRAAIGISVSLILFGAALPGASAQSRCAEGKAINGKCVQSDLALAMRRTSVIFSQPKISQTAFPILPTQDLEYRYPHQLIPDPLRPAPAFVPSP